MFANMSSCIKVSIIKFNDIYIVLLTIDMATKRLYRNTDIKFTFIPKEQARGNDGKENVTEATRGGNLERNPTQK